MERDDGDGARAVSEAGARVREDVAQLRRAAARAGDEVHDRLRRFVDEHPVAAIGIAFGAGYLLSGALVSRTTLRLVAFGARALVGPLVKSMIGSGLGEAHSPMGGG
jgi:hypothetical protein